MPSSLIDDVLRVVSESDVSDLILHAGKVPMVRRGGEILELDSPEVSADDLAVLWQRCGAPAGARDFDAALVAENGVRFRVNLLQQLGAPAAVLRRIRSGIPDMDALGLPSDLIREWAARPAGIIVVSGPTGSGKSTTVAAALEWINESFARHVVTIEDPIEYLFAPKRSVFTQREVGIDTASYAEGLRRSLRQNPDVIFLGEIRDAASAITALQAAETGHLVFATLHASSCGDVVERLQFLFPALERESVARTLANQLVGVLCQRLVPTEEGSLVLLVEYFSNHGSSRNIIAENRMPDLRDFISRGNPRFARSFADSLLILVKAGRVSEETALAISENPQEFSRMLRGISSSAQATRR